MSVINVSGQRLGTAEVESSPVAHPNVSESVVVGYPHSVKGQGICTYVTLTADDQPGDALKDEWRNRVRKDIGAVAFGSCRIFWCGYSRKKSRSSQTSLPET